MNQILGITDTLDHVIYFEHIKKTIIENESISLIDLVEVFHEFNPHPIKRVVLQIDDTLEQITYFETLKTAILTTPKMSTVELVKLFLQHHPDTIKGSMIAVQIDGEIKLMRRGEIDKEIARLNEFKPEKIMKNLFTRQISEQPNVNDTNLRSNDTG